MLNEGSVSLLTCYGILVVGHPSFILGALGTGVWLAVPNHATEDPCISDTCPGVWGGKIPRSGVPKSKGTQVVDSDGCWQMGDPSKKIAGP